MKSALVLLTHFITLQSSKLNKSIFQASDALSTMPGTRASDIKLRVTMKVTWSSFSYVHLQKFVIAEVLIVSFSLQKFVNKARRLVRLLGCATSTEDVFAPAPMRSLASSSHAASSSRAVQEDEDEDEDGDEEGEDEEEGKEEVEEEHGEEEEGDDEKEEDHEGEEYDDDDGPPTTQPTQREKRNVPKKDWKSPSPFQKACPTQRKKKTTGKRSKANEDRTAKRERRD